MCATSASAFYVNIKVPNALCKKDLWSKTLYKTPNRKIAITEVQMSTHQQNEFAFDVFFKAEFIFLEIIMPCF